MDRKKLDELIAQIENYLECWKQFNHNLTLARTKKFDPEDESQFLELKSVLAQQLEIILASVETSALNTWLWNEHKIITVAINHAEFTGLRVTPSVYTIKEELDRYVIRGVVGPDEYHERVNNNAYTSMVAKATFEIANATVKHLAQEHPAWVSMLTAQPSSAPTSLATISP